MLLFFTRSTNDFFFFFFCSVLVLPVEFKTVPPSLWLVLTCSSFAQIEIFYDGGREETPMLLENQDDESKDMIKEIILKGIP